MPPSSLLTPQEAEAVLTLSLFAAFADGTRSEEERTRISEIGNTLPIENYAAIMQRVVLKQVTADQVSAQIASSEGKSLAYEMALYVCEADGSINDQEQQFLDSLKTTLGLNTARSAAVEVEAQKIMNVPVQTDPSLLSIEPQENEVKGMILNYAILAGALELLPQSLATMAIVPIQMRMVYRIGKLHGTSLDQGHIKEFLATAGVGLTAQLLEGFARRLLGQIGKRVGGRVVGTLVDATTGAAMTFAATYALGHAAETYYAGGRRMDVNQLRSVFQNLLGEGKSLFNRYSSQITSKAQTLSLSDLLPLARRS